MVNTRILIVGLVVALSAPSAFAGELSPAGFKKLKKQIKIAMAQQDGEALAAAITDIANDDSKDAVDLILKAAVSVPSGKVFSATASAIEGMSSDDALETINAHVSKKGGHPGVKILCIDGLAAHEDDASAEALGAALSDKRPEVVRAVLGSIRKRAKSCKNAVTPLIDLLERQNKRPDALIRADVVTALAEITGKYFEKIEDWRKYWEVKKASFRPQSGGTLPAGMTTGERAGEKPPTFFGSEIRSERLVFIIDTSGSMEGDRLQKCKEQLKGCIKGLGKRSKFTIVSYSHKIKVWNPKLLPANDKNKGRAAEFVDGLKASGNTYTLSAMLQGFDVKDADAIVLLSDGMPTERKSEKDKDSPLISGPEILEKIDAENRFRKWRVDTFGFEGVAGGSLSKFMRELAETNNGTFTPIK